MDIREICLSLPNAHQSSETAEKNPRPGMRIAGVAASLLIIVSILIHIVLAVFVYKSLQGDIGNNLLMSLVLPGYSVNKTYESEETPVIPDKTADSGAGEGEATGPSNIVSKDLAAIGERGFSLKNETDYNPDLDVLFNSPNPIEKADKLYERYQEASPLVLILHTHGSESYSDTNDTGSFRSADPTKSVVAVGDVLTAVLERAGIKTVHLTEMFDKTSFNTAYDRSAAAVKKVLGENPSIQYILDIHRDSIATDAGAYVSADFRFNGIDCAQLMFVIGTDHAGSSHTGWRDNLSVALQLQNLLFAKSSSIMRPLNLRSASFYQNLRKGSLLLEVGTCGNTLTEAKNSAVIFASVLADYILGRNAGLDIAALTGELCK